MGMHVATQLTMHGTHIVVQKQATSELYRQVKQKIGTDRVFILKFGMTVVPEDDTTVYAAICDGAQLVAKIPTMLNLYVDVQKNSITVILPEVRF